MNNSFLGFHEIPSYSNYVVNTLGQVLNIKTNTVLEGSVNPDGYHNYRLKHDRGFTYTWGRHRLLAYVFKNPGCCIDNLVVNHINAIKGDDRLDNLEWVTYQGNAEHAGSLGLTEKCVPISVRCVDTGDVLNFASIIECSRVFGLSKDAVNYRVKIGERRVFPERKQYRFSTESAPWYIPADIKTEMLKNSTCKKILLRHVLTHQVIEFNKVSDLSVYLNVPISTITLWVNQNDQPVLPGLIQIKWGSDLSPWRIVVDVYLEINIYTGKKSVTATQRSTGVIKNYTSAVDCARDMNLSTTALNYRLKSNGEKVFSDGYSYNYYSISHSV